MVLHPAAPQLADLDLLLSVDRLGSLGKAAREHGVSQPAASVRIQAMERRLGLRLLERTPSGSHFTPAGVALAKWAQAAVNAVSQFMTCSTTLNTPGVDSLGISTCLTIAEYLIPRWVTGLRTRLPELDVSVHVDSTESVLESVRSGKADLGFVGGSRPYSDLHQRVVGHDQLTVVVAPDHPWARLPAPLAPGELAKGPLILREKGFGNRETLRRALGELWRDNHLELPSTTAIKEAVEVGGGAGILSLLAVARDLEAGRVVRVPVGNFELTRTLWAVWDKKSRPSATAQALLDLAEHEQRTLRPTRFPITGAGADVRPLSSNKPHIIMPTASAS
jgi:DNA-binding transcriptional LysR family regulator